MMSTDEKLEIIGKAADARERELMRETAKLSFQDVTELKTLYELKIAIDKEITG